MSDPIRPLRLRLAALGFVVAYVPITLFLIGVIFAPGVDSVQDSDGRLVETETSTAVVSDLWLVLIAIAMVPVAAALAWWWSGRAVRPVARAMEVQAELIDEASHELRTPLAVLRTNAEVLLSKAEPTSDDYRQGLERSGAAAERMSATIDGLLVGARGESRTIVRAPADISAIARAAAEGIDLLAVEQGVQVAVDAPQSIEARVDPTSVERALTNLLTNAIRHSPSGGTVSLVTSEADGTVEIAVSDEGPGIAAEEQDQIFQRHWQRDPGGTAGIGLAIVEQVALAHGGSVVVESPVADGHGACFRLRLES